MGDRAFSFIPINQRPAKPRSVGVTEIRGPYYTAIGPRYLEDIFAGNPTRFHNRGHKICLTAAENRSGFSSGSLRNPAADNGVQCPTETHCEVVARSTRLW